MNKKLISLAVAAAMAAPAAAMAEATLYGIIHQSIDYYDVDGDGFNGWTLNRGQEGKGAPRSNRIGVKGSEDLGGGLKAIYQIEFGINTADEAGSSNDGDRGDAVNMRNTFAGLASSWGTFLVGRHDTPLKISTGKLDLFADTMADYNGTVGFNDIRADNAIAYISPSFSGFQFAGAVVPGGGHTVSGYENIDSDSLAEGWSVAVIYTNGPFYGSAAYESLTKDLGTNEFTIEGDLFADVQMVPGLAPVSGYVEDPANPGTMIAAPGSEVLNDEDWNKWRVGLGLLDWNGFTLTAIYENWENGPVGGVFVNDNDRDMWQVQAGFAFGNNMVKAMYGQADRDTGGDDDEDVEQFIRNLGDKDLSTWAVGFDHNFSKRTKAYALYTNVDDDLSDSNSWDGFSLGIVHKF